MAKFQMQVTGTKLGFADQETVQMHLGLVLDSPAFRSSQRSSHFLRFVVETALAGEAHLLKERIIGERIFGRPPDYDTGQDSIVRVKANEVRRRLAQYYDLHPNSAVRIELPTGSYQPSFHFTPPPAQKEVALVSEQLLVLQPGRTKSRLGVAIAVTVILGIIAAGALYSTRTGAPQTAFDLFWSPFFSGPNELRLCVPTPDTYRIYGGSRQALVDAFRPLAPGTPRPKLDQSRLQDVQIVPETGFFLGLGDAHAMSLLSTFATLRGKTAQVRYGYETSFTELRAGPSILVGGFTNRWTIDLMKEARFVFATDGPEYGIRDNTTGKFICKKQRSWEARPSHDCAVVARTVDSKTGHPLLVAAGLDHFGTYAVGEFLTRPARLLLALDKAPAGWEGKNLQIVFRIEIMRDNVGPPQVLATHVW
ncbi:MAG: hypothetical protein JNK48_14340 [Bryobacterales bacterium]|nr:hypothetical protein [Bryobacterales bacterium]